MGAAGIWTVAVHEEGEHHAVSVDMRWLKALFVVVVGDPAGKKVDCTLVLKTSFNLFLQARSGCGRLQIAFRET